MHIHILGICGTFMAGLAQLARATGHSVSGSDQNVYPPMSEYLAAAGIEVRTGWDPKHLSPKPDIVIIGNALSRGNPLVEAVLNAPLPYTSGAAWLAEQILPGQHVIAVAGTHGKTTTTSIVAWMLEQNGYQPGFLVGGIPENFGQPARLGHGRFFVVEADEYDTAFFDKRSKFIHYRPATLILNNLEYDHADIFPDLAAIQSQFHQVIRTVPGNGSVVWNADDANLAQTLARGCWTPCVKFGTGPDANYRVWSKRENGTQYLIEQHSAAQQFVVPSTLLGAHNALNVCAAVAAVAQVGIAPAAALSALATFKNVKRRLEVVGTGRGVTVYDDFAHHPTAIAATLQGVRELVGSAPVFAVLEPRSNTMRLGVHRTTLAPALRAADRVFLYAPAKFDWNLETVCAEISTRGTCHSSIEELIQDIQRYATPGTHVVIMSNGAFDGLHRRLVQALQQPSPT